MAVLKINTAGGFFEKWLFTLCDKSEHCLLYSSGGLWLSDLLCSNPEKGLSKYRKRERLAPVPGLDAPLARPGNIFKTEILFIILFMVP